MLTLTKAYAKELAPHGIRVNAVSPGLIGGTPFHNTFTTPEAFAATVKTIPLGRAGAPEDVATGHRLPRGRGRRVSGRRDDRNQRRHVHAMTRHIPRLRWLIISLIFLATVINYIDRQTVSVLKTVHQRRPRPVERRLRRHPEQLPAALRHQPDGVGPPLRPHRHAPRLRLLDRRLVGRRHRARVRAHRVHFRVCRGVLGFGEAGNWPGAAKVVGEWFPVKERALGMGIFNTGAALGGAVSPPIIAWLATAYGWRSTFIVTGLLGFGWLLLWLLLFRVPEQHPWITEPERAHILEGRASAQAPAEGVADPGWRGLLHLPADVGGRRRPVHHRSDLVALHLLAAELLPGGARVQPAADRLVGVAAVPLRGHRGALGWLGVGVPHRQGWSVDRARKTVMAAGALLTPAGILAMRAESPYIALLVDGARALRLPGLDQQPPDAAERLLSRTAVASVFGLGGTAPRLRACCTTGAPAASSTRWATRRCSSARASSARSASSSPWGSPGGSRRYPRSS